MGLVLDKCCCSNEQRLTRDQDDFMPPPILNRPQFQLEFKDSDEFSAKKYKEKEE